MEPNHKQNYFKRSEAMSTFASNQWKSISRKGGVPKNAKGCEVLKMSSRRCKHSSASNVAVSRAHSSYEQSENYHKTISSEKSHGIRGFLRLLPFLPRFKHKTNVSKQQLARRQTSMSRIQICPSSSLEETDVRKLIRLYQSYENLYDPRHPDYGNRIIDEMCYSKIAGKFYNKTSQELQSLLYELRLLFEQEYTIIENKQRRFGQFVLPSIKYYSEFMFLVPFLDIKWESGACLPPQIPLIEESNSCTSDGTDSSPRNSKDLVFKDLNKVNTPTSREKSSLEVNEGEVEEVQPMSNYITGAHKNSSNIVRPAAGKNLIDTRPLYGNQFMCFGKKKNKEENKEEKLENQSLDAAVSIPLEEHTSQITSPTSQITSPTSQITSPTSQITSPTSQEGKSSQSEPMSQKRTSQSEVSQEESSIIKTPEKVPSLPQKQPSETPCPLNKDQEPCEAPCNPQRSQTLTTSRPPILKNANSARRLSSQTLSENQAQLEVLCDMIKMELSSTPDFIYFDAKWRIIEILREVQKRNLIHSKSDPVNNGNDICKCPSNAICKKREESREAKAPRCRIRGPAKATQCPYCCSKRG